MRLLTTIILAAISCSVLAQAAATVDSTAVKERFFTRFIRYFDESNDDKTFDKKFDISVIGGPSYSQDKGFSISALVGGQFRTNQRDSITQPSFVQVFASVSTTLFYAAGIDGNTFWLKSKHRLNYEVVFSSLPTFYWKPGFYGGAYGDKKSYLRQTILFKGDYLYSLWKNVYVGGLFNIADIEGKRFAESVDLLGQKSRYTSIGAGLIFRYDSRDVVTSPHRGLYANLEHTYFPKSFGNNNFNRTMFNLKLYQKLWKGAVLAYEINGTFHSADVPWTMYAQVGGSYSMRGYYKGQYSDRNLLDTQLELRQTVWRRIGVVAWIGGANLFANKHDFDWSHTLFNYGAGIRWEFKKRMNIRVDFGVGRNTSGVVFNISEAF